MRLVLVGRVDGSHTSSEEWRRLIRLGLLRCVDHRISYRSALAASRAADCLVILEANAAESPFFPAKLADYLWLGKPIIAVSPKASATADILGRDNPLLIEPADHVAAAVAFERIWDAWRTGNLAQLAPAGGGGVEHVRGGGGRKTGEIFEFLLKTNAPNGNGLPEICQLLRSRPNGSASATSSAPNASRTGRSATP